MLEIDSAKQNLEKRSLNSVNNLTCVPESAPSRVCMEQPERNISKAMRIQQYKPPTPKLRPDRHTLRADLKQHGKGLEN